MSEKEKNTAIDTTVSIEKLIGRLESLEQENKKLRKQNLLVGIRWYGYGGLSLGLGVEIAGHNKVDLEEYGAKAVIDYNTWNNLKKAQIVQEGVLVRDDLVIQELNIFGDVASVDIDKNPNAFTDEEIISLLSGSRKKLEKVVEEVTYFPVLSRFKKVLPKSGSANKGDITRYLSDKCEELETKFRWGALDKWEILAAAERAGLEVAGMDANILREELIKKELNLLKRGK